MDKTDIYYFTNEENPNKVNLINEDINLKINILKFLDTLEKHQKESFNIILEDIELKLQKANMDDLSGLYNINGFNKIFKNNIKKYKNGLINCIGLIMIDMNFLKSINDNFGHKVGN